MPSAVGWVDPYGSCAWSLSVLFAARVLGQAVQRWMPQPFLPPFEAFQGSSLPYWLLLSFQLLILVVMVRVAWRVQTDRLVPSRRVGLWLAGAGSVYMAFALGRIAVGLAVPDADAWFKTWIPAFFPLVLATYLPILAAALVIVVLELRFPERLEWRPQGSDVAADAAFMAFVQILPARPLAVLVVF